jgi:anti-sigma factor RsiW
MAQAHPTELELLEYVEGELADGPLETLRVHLEGCPACAAQVADLERGRVLLRSAPLLELPERRRKAIFAALPRQERARPAWLELLSSPRRVALVLVPAAAVAAAVTVVVTQVGNGGFEREAAKEAPPPAEVAQAEADSAATGGAVEAPEAAPAPPALEAAAAPVATVVGPPEDVVAFLEGKGFRARVVDGTVEVTGADEEAVKEALSSRAAGDVPVFLRPE